jgi:hypothetical protein
MDGRAHMTVFSLCSIPTNEDVVYVEDCSDCLTIRDMIQMESPRQCWLLAYHSARGSGP